jgi:putative transposase
MNTKHYYTDLTDAQWELLKGLLADLLNPEKRGQGRPRRVDLRRIIDAIFYIDRAGCQYRLLPHDFPPWQTVYYYFRKWTKDGTLKRIHDALAEQVRQQERPTPRTTVSIDSQTTDSAGAQEDRAYDGAKKLEGRKRHIIVDSLGLVIAIFVSAGNVTDAEGGKTCLGQVDPEKYPEVDTVFGDGAYKKEGFPDKVQDWKPGCKLNVIDRPKNAEGFVKLPIRWVVERTHAWMTKNRRLCRSYEHLTKCEKSYMHVFERSSLP